MSGIGSDIVTRARGQACDAKQAASRLISDHLDDLLTLGILDDLLTYPWYLVPVVENPEAQLFFLN